MTIRVVIFLLVLSLPIIITEDLDGNFYWTRIDLPAADTAEAHARLAYEYFFKYGSYGVPENVKVLNVKLVDGTLTVDVSETVMDYGGSAFEQALVAQLLKIAAEIPGVCSFTLTVDGTPQPLVQGTKLVNTGV